MPSTRKRTLVFVLAGLVVFASTVAYRSTVKNEVSAQLRLSYTSVREFVRASDTVADITVNAYVTTKQCGEYSYDFFLVTIRKVETTNSALGNEGEAVLIQRTGPSGFPRPPDGSSLLVAAYSFGAPSSELDRRLGLKPILEPYDNGAWPIAEGVLGEPFTSLTDASEFTNAEGEHLADLVWAKLDTNELKPAQPEFVSSECSDGTDGEFEEEPHGKDGEFEEQPQ
jgi:hypothetical protein